MIIHNDIDSHDNDNDDITLDQVGNEPDQVLDMQPSAMAPRARIPDSLISHSGWNRVSWNVECSQQILIRFSEERFLYRNELIGGRERERVR